MITVTERAADHLQKIMQEKDLPKHGLRVSVQGGGCAGLQYGMAFENAEREDDTVVESQGLKVFVDSFSAHYLEGACIDYEETHVGGGFRVINPNAVASCACGSSFRTEGHRESQTSAQ